MLMWKRGGWKEGWREGSRVIKGGETLWCVGRRSDLPLHCRPGVFIPELASAARSARADATRQELQFTCRSPLPVQVPLQPGQSFKFTVLETLDRIKEEFQFLQAQYHRYVSHRAAFILKGTFLTISAEDKKTLWSSFNLFSVFPVVF